MKDYIWDPAVCPSSLNEHGQPMTEGETAHKWDASTDPITCAECGTVQDADTNPAPCPLCTEPLEHKQQNGTHIYSCPGCPFLGLEYYSEQNITDFLLAPR